MVEWVKDEKSWEAIAPEWSRLLASGEENYPFLAFPVLRAWWQHRGGGEWPADSELRILVERSGDKVRGIAPMFRVPGDQEPTYRLIGTREIMDYLGALCEPSGMDGFCETICEAMQALPAGSWRRIILSNLHPESPTLPALENAARKFGWQTERVALEECPVIPLPGSWDAYLAQLDKKHRHEIRRKVRRAEAEHSLEVRIAPGDQVEVELGHFLALMENDPRKASFLTDPMRAQFHALALAAHESGMLELAFLLIDGEYAAGFYNFDYQMRTWVYNSGMNPAFAALSPGWVLLAKLIQRAIERGQTAFDFMRGNEDYKFHWGGKAQQLIQLSIAQN